MVIEFYVSYIGGTPDNEFVGTIYKSSNETYRLNFTFDVSPAQIYLNYMKPDESGNLNPIQITQEFLLIDDMTDLEGDLLITLSLVDGDQRLFTRPIHLEIRE